MACPDASMRYRHKGEQKAMTRVSIWTIMLVGVSAAAVKAENSDATLSWDVERSNVWYVNSPPSIRLRTKMDGDEAKGVIASELASLLRPRRKSAPDFARV